MRKRFKSLLTLIMFLIICCVAIGIGYLFYKEVLVSSDIVVDGTLTINYLSGKSFKLNGNKSVEFAVTNNGEEEQFFYIQFTDIYAKDVLYKITSAKDDLNLTNSLKSDIVFNHVAINPLETIKYKLEFIPNNEDTYRGSINIGIKKNEENTFADVVLKNNNISDISISNIGEPATLDEGLFSAQDDLGIAYYFRGKTETNYVSFADLMWRIVKINGDGSVKIVLNNSIEEISKYYENDYNFKDSSIDKSLNSFFDISLQKYADYIAYYKFCNDLTLDQDNQTYAAFNRISINNIPNLVCLGNQVNLKIGLLTIDEVILAGGSKKANKDYYLYNSEITTPYFTMSSAKLSDNKYYPFTINVDGSYNTTIAGNLLRGVRPVINIIRNAKVIGDGTKDNPYQIIMN